ncbi:MAG: HDOD domain-containing protein [Spirochaetia bacterium]|nr:HDOD domain-containing protein [Spirochaetia bacterium]
MITRFTFYEPNDSLNQEVRQNLRLFLEKEGLKPCVHIIETVLSELIQNAIKANLKRSYFLEHKLDLKRDYIKGNDGFRAMLEEDSPGLIALGARHRAEVRVTFKIQKEILISVWNPSIALAEQARIRKSLAQKKIKPGSDALAEGAGLGLTMSTSLMSGLGLSGALKFKADKKGGNFTIHIPRNVGRRAAAAKKISRFIKGHFPLPILPQTADKLRTLKGDDRLLRLLSWEDPALFVNVNGSVSRKLFQKKRPSAVTSPDALLLANRALRLAQASRKVAQSRKLPADAACKAGLLDSIGLYFLYSLNQRDLTELRRLTGRGKPSVEPALRESTVGISPDALSGLLLTWAGLTMSPMTSVLAEARNSLEND